MMITAAARQLAGKRVCFVGIGLPNIAVNLAARTVAPDLQMVYEAGVYGARPARLPISIGDPTLVTGATASVSMFELFSFYLQGGLVDVGFLGGAQIDRFGNLNTTVIGPYDAPSVRLPGSGGACEIAINAAEVFVIMRQGRRSFVDALDFRTSAGARRTDADPAFRRPGRGPTVVVTDLAVFGFDAGEMVVESLHPGVTREMLLDSMAWEPHWGAEVGVTEPPSVDELRLIREELDPAGIYARG
jgi:glutaconate CoA-transferase subunit B